MINASSSSLKSFSRVNSNALQSTLRPSQVCKRRRSLLPSLAHLPHLHPLSPTYYLCLPLPLLATRPSLAHLALRKSFRPSSLPSRTPYQRFSLSQSTQGFVSRVCYFQSVACLIRMPHLFGSSSPTLIKVIPSFAQQLPLPFPFPFPHASPSPLPYSYRTLTRSFVVSTR